MTKNSDLPPRTGAAPALVTGGSGYLASHLILGIEYRPLRDTMTEHYQAWAAR